MAADNSRTSVVTVWVVLLLLVASLSCRVAGVCLLRVRLVTRSPSSSGLLLHGAEDDAGDPRAVTTRHRHGGRLVGA